MDDYECRSSLPLRAQDEKEGVAEGENTGRPVIAWGYVIIVVLLGTIAAIIGVRFVRFTRRSADRLAEREKDEGEERQMLNVAVEDETSRGADKGQDAILSTDALETDAIESDAMETDAIETPPPG
jgi:flagellar biosynthesis/type III secretory pathway M-ring protein FliF/YscJ